MATAKFDWNAIRAEYISGGISQRQLAEKYGVSETTLMKRASKERWNDKRKQADSKSVEIAQQKTANAIADNAAIAQRIKQKLLKRLEKEIDELPEHLGSETYSEVVAKDKKGNRTTKGRRYRLNDLAQSYKTLVGDLPEIDLIDNVEDDPLTKSLKEFAEGLESGEDNADK
jgi:transcriptional regulator with XRE-family HTH domain